MKKFISLIGVLLVGSAMAYSLDIPLGGTTDSSGGAKIAFVDMDKIYQVFPQTSIAKQDYAVQLKKKRDQLSEKEAELTLIQGRIFVLESTLKQGTDPSVQDETNKSPQSLTAMKKELDDKKFELEELRNQSKQDLASFERQQSQLILGKIYQALKDVASEEQVSVVVDKASILFGDTAIDLTEKLQQRVRGY